MRAPAVQGAGPEPGPEPTPLRLSVTRGALGIELYRPLSLSPLSIDGLFLTLPGLRFPVDLSGGVPVFRHRRGDLEHLALSASTGELAAWLGPRLGGVIGQLVRPVTVWARRDVIGVGLAAEGAALAFELLWAPIGSDARFVVADARGVGLGGPALAHALRAVDTAIGGIAERRGRIVEIEQVGRLLGRAVLPRVGARAPAARRVRFGELGVGEQRLEVELDASILPPVFSVEAARWLELGELVADADADLVRGQLDAARDRYLAALEQAPRHPEIARLIADIDLAIGGREEAALGMLVESMQAVRAGWTGAQLLSGVGDWDGARSAVLDAAREERYPPLAALLLTRLAEISPDAREQIEALDRAVASCPALPEPRWARFDARARAARIEEALGDAQHLEAAADGARARHEVCCRAARSLQQIGHLREAGKLFERALRYLPDDPAATAGLARSLVETGQPERAFALLERAVALGERAGRAEPDALVDLARLVADRLGDLPQGIARVRQVHADTPRVVEARALEGRWRARLGDRVGASLAFSRLRETLDLQADPEERDAAWLLEAARFEREVQGDAAAAERHLAVALRIAPRDPAVGRAYREVGAQLAAAARRPPPETPPAAPPPAADDDEPDVQQVERLRAALDADPDDTELALRLLDLLHRLGQNHELLALVSARLEEAGAAERERLVPRARSVLERLHDEAHEAGRVSEAELYAEALRRL